MKYLLFNKSIILLYNYSYKNNMSFVRNIRYIFQQQNANAMTKRYYSQALQYDEAYEAYEANEANEANEAYEANEANKPYKPYKYPLNRQMYEHGYFNEYNNLCINADPNENKCKQRIQYLSDVHVDMLTVGKLPKVYPFAKTLAICGDIGNPIHKNFELFLSAMSNSFEKVLFVPGNHEYDCSPKYEKHKVEKFKPIIANIVSKYDNIVLLDNSTTVIENEIVVIGSTCWSVPKHEIYFNDIRDHITKQTEDVEWIKNTIKKYSKNDIIVMTHVPPTFKLMEEKYKKINIKNHGWFYNNYDHLLKPPVIAWLCGHTHSVISCNINGIICAINAYGYNNYDNNIKTKVIEI